MLKCGWLKGWKAITPAPPAGHRRCSHAHKKLLKSCPLKESSLKKLPILLLCSVLHVSNSSVQSFSLYFVSPCWCYCWALGERGMNQILVLRIQFKDFTVQRLEWWEIHRVLIRREEGYLLRRLPFWYWIFLPSFSLSGWKPHKPLAVSSSTASALTPGYSVPSLTSCVMLGKSGDCSVTHFFIGKRKWPLKPFVWFLQGFKFICN